MPSTYSAYVLSESPVLVSNVFHELFGHGLFCEYSVLGKKLVEIEKSNLDTKTFLSSPVEASQLFGLAKQNIWNYEGFAMWLEHLLCKETENKQIWEARAATLSKQYSELLDYFICTEQKMSRLGFISQLGFPKKYEKHAVVMALKKLCADSFQNIRFAVLYGSKRPESDIDLFVVSSNPSRNYFNGWFDIYELNNEEFQMQCSCLDISVTDPLFSGELIQGNALEFEKIKDALVHTPINNYAIEYNDLRSKALLIELPRLKDERLKKNCISYIASFSLNSKNLAQGIKHMTLKNLEKSLG